ncbi:hypothetical protein [Phocaeicola massiliensis]|uniref:hypothetical protein n=1 Tax=Phocaeicola massiliensis TaxID=204516 RepID=UPI00270D6F77|nr:hypothetical protein [Peptoniphilus sp.]
MNVEEIKQKKQELGEKIAVLLNGFEDETGVQVSDVGFVRRVVYDELGREVCKVYVIEVEVKL